MTKPLPRIALAVLAAAVMGAAQAGTETIAITAPAHAAMRGVFPSEGEAIAGNYQMSDGRTMVLRQRGRFVIADLDGVPQTRLLATGHNSLSSADDSMTMRFDTDAADGTSRVTVSLRQDHSPRVSLASVSKPRR